MGRKAIYRSAEEKKDARSKWNKSYYDKNKENIMKKYYELRKSLQSDY